VDGSMVVPDPNYFDGDISVHRSGDEISTWPAKGTTTSRGIGVVELARAIRAGRPERASGELGYHVLDVMVATIESGQRHETIEIESTVQVAPALEEGWDPSAATLA
jgi:predicted dehydrogenase